MKTKMIKVDENTHLKLKVQAYNSGRTLQDYMKYLADTDISEGEETLKVMIEVFANNHSNPDEDKFIQGFITCFETVFINKETLPDGMNDSIYYEEFRDKMNTIEE